MRTGFWLILLAGLPPTLMAQESFQDWAQSQRAGFQEFREQRDKAFHQFLQKEWQAFQMHKGEVEDAAPKPDTIPEAPPRPKPKASPEESETEPGPQDEPARRAPSEPEGPSRSDPMAKPEPAGEPQPEPETEAAPESAPAPKAKPQETETSESEPQPDPQPQARPSGESPSEPAPGGIPEPTPEPAPQAASTQAVEVAFLGHELRIQIPEAWADLKLKEAGKQGVADFWADFAKSEVGGVVEQLQEIRNRLALNDWGYLQVSHALARAVHEEEQTALATVWGLLLKSGYDARVGFQDDRLVLLYNSQQQLFDLPYFDLDGKRYYVFAPSRQVQKLTTYEGDYQGAEQNFAVAPKRAPKPADVSKTRTLRFQFDKRDYAIEVPVSPELVRYFDSIPQMAVAAYFRYQPRPQIQEALVGQLKEATDGMPRDKQVNLLLRFVQNAFEYETDQKQFGQENYLFPEETLFYPASDCEDRSVLFAFLVRQVLGLEVAVLDFPGHVATAVDLPATEQGAHVQLDGRSLIVADPTYINANAGMLMPDFRGEKPKVIPLGEG